MFQGMPKECIPDQMGVWHTVGSWLAWHLSWTADPCERYHRALLVDPLWEVTPGMVCFILRPLRIFQGKQILIG